MDTKKRASGKTDGWGREEERLGEGGQWLEAIMGLEMGSELRRGEWRGKKKGEAALGDKGSRAYGARGRRGLRDLDAEMELPARLAAESDRLCSKPEWRPAVT